MKTYWLHGRLKNTKQSVPTTPTLTELPAAIDPLRAEDLLDAADSRSLYSPVTFEDVSRYSPILSPTSSTISDILPNIDSFKMQEPTVASYTACHRKGNVSDVICLGRMNIKLRQLHSISSSHLYPEEHAI